MVSGASCTVESISASREGTGTSAVERNSWSWRSCWARSQDRNPCGPQRGGSWFSARSIPWRERASQRCTYWMAKRRSAGVSVRRCSR